MEKNVIYFENIPKKIQISKNDNENTESTIANLENEKIWRTKSLYSCLHASYDIEFP